WEEKNHRWQIGLCRNEDLVTDLGVVCRLLKYRLRFSHAYIPYRRGQELVNAEIIRGSLSENEDQRLTHVRLRDLGLPARNRFSLKQAHSVALLKTKYQLITRKNLSGAMTQLANYVLNGDLEPAKIAEIQHGTLRHFYDIALEQNHVFALANGLLTHNSN